MVTTYIFIWKKRSKKKTKVPNAGLPDSFFSNQKSKFGQILEDLRFPNLGKYWRTLDWKMFIYVFYGYLEYLRTFGIFYDHLVQLCSFGTFFSVLVSCTKKNLATLTQWMNVGRCKKLWRGCTIGKFGLLFCLPTCQVFLQKDPKMASGLCWR
jgi:hypothetical protein